MVGAFRQQAVDERGVDLVGREHRIGDALRRVLIVVQTGGAEGEVEIGDTESSDRSRAIAQATLWATVDEPTPPLAPTMAMMRPTALASGAENRLQTERTTSMADRGKDVADAAAYQFAIEHDVVDAADHDHPGAGVAHGGEPSRPRRMSLRPSVSRMITFGVGAER